jgi:hypothetical protein
MIALAQPVRLRCNSRIDAFVRAHTMMGLKPLPEL